MDERKQKEEALCQAAVTGDTVRVKQLIEEGVNPNAADKWQMTPLYLAVWNGDHETVSALLTAGADVNVRDRQQRTLLHLAAEKGHHETVSALLEAGADVNVQDSQQMSPLHLAADHEKGHHETVSALLASGADVNVQDRQQRTPLHRAAKKGHHETVIALLTAGADVNVQDSVQMSPLHLAADDEKSHHETVSALLTAGADVNVHDRQQRTPLHRAAKKGHHETVTALLTAGADVNVQDSVQRSPLHLAAENGHHETVSALLTSGADVDARDELQRSSLKLAAWKGHHGTASALLAAGAGVNALHHSEKNTLLIWSAWKGHHKSVSALLASGADVNVRDSQQRTPLYLAAEEGHHGTVSALLRAGADVNVRDYRKNTLLISAARGGDHETVSALLAAGADVNTRGLSGLWTPLHWAAQNGHHDTVSVLLAAGTDVNVRDRLATTPLEYLAANRGHHETVTSDSALLAAGADVNVSNMWGMTPLHLAAEKGHHETVSALLAAGADVNVQDRRQWTPLHRAAQNGHHGTVSALLAAGADVNVQDVEGHNPLHYATEREHSKCVEVLLQHEAVKDIKKDPEFVDLEQMLDTILSRLDETDVRLLMRVWSARTGKRESPGAEVPADLMKDMMKTEYFTTGDLVQLEKDMIAAGISFPAVVRDIPGVPDELKYTRTVESAVGPMDGELEIPGFVKLIVPPGVLQQDTLITISTVDVAAILRDPESFNWTSGYPWSLGEDAPPHELLDQVLFSPAVDVNLHGAQLTGDLEMQTWRPPGSEGMECLVLKHHDGEGWTDITASTEHQIYLDKISISVHSFSPVAFVWAPVEAIISVGKTMISALSSRTLNCRFAAHIKPLANDVQFHAVCRDERVETDEYLPGFTWCGSNAAMFDLFHGDVLDIAVNVHGGQDNISEHMVLNSKQCCDKNGQNVQMMLDRPNRNCVKGNVHVKKVQGTSNRIACQFIFKEEGDTYQRDYKRDKTTEEADSTRIIPTEQVESVRQNLAATEGDRKKEDVLPAETSRPHAGPGDIRTDSIVRGSGSKPVVLLINDEYSNSHGGVSTIHCQMASFLVSKGAAVYSTVLDATENDQGEAAADGVQLIPPTTFEGDKRKPNLDWLTWDHQTRYPNLPSDVAFIIGHVNITSRAARQIKELRLPDAKLVQVTHEIPEETSHYQGDEKVMSIGEESDSILDDLRHADVIFSVGPLMYDYYQTKQLKCEHHEFLPRPSDMFSEMQVKYVNTKAKTVLSMGTIIGAESLKGYDISAKAMHIVIDHLPNTKWRACGVSAEDFPESKKIIQANVEKGNIHFTPLKHTTQEELSRHIQQAHVVLMPSRAEPFGLVGLEAIAAGVPVLVSHKSGLAWFLKSQDPEFDRLIVEISDGDEEATKTLAKRIITVLKDGGREFQAARRLREKLLASKYWEDSHSKFLEAFGL